MDSSLDGLIMEETLLVLWYTSVGNIHVLCSSLYFIDIILKVFLVRGDQTHEQYSMLDCTMDL